MKKICLFFTISLVLLLSACGSAESSSEAELPLNSVPPKMQNCYGEITKSVDFLVVDMKVTDTRGDSFTAAKEGDTVRVYITPTHFDDEGLPLMTKLDYYVNFNVGSKVELTFTDDDTDIFEDDGTVCIRQKKGADTEVTVTGRAEYFDEESLSPDCFDENGQPLFITREEYEALEAE